MNEFALALLILSLLGLAAVFGVYPLLTWVRARRRCYHSLESLEETPPAIHAEVPLPTVSILVAIRNGAELLPEKIESLDALDYPAELLQRVWVSDGSTDETERLLHERVPHDRVLILPEHVGKAAALNRGVAHCEGELLVFTDADAFLERDAVRQLARHFRDPAVGGVCGRRVLRREDSSLDRAQSRYADLDSLVKELESRCGSITSNDGKLYCIRRSLFREVREGVTDDLYVALNVVSQGARFIYESRARAKISTPSRDAAHEVSRRRRIVCRSLRGMLVMKHLFNPFRTGWFSFGLFVNKVLRRMIPFFLIGVFAASIILCTQSPWWLGFVCLQLAFYLGALLSPRGKGLAIVPGLGKLFSAAFYFCVGNWGTALGVGDFLLNRRFVKWDPRKAA